ncbi:Fe-only nitrogenase accessory protein AnfO [Sodalis ligni]|uniref:Fe-only nitrogenase accessory protein AnfO n=1 Tax=Sodalis ligni TaxID=2697027 RepID=UPI00193EEE5D|nr:Fe-only nitrogenase accessory protein AnfO [Sodalis ligni]QWA11352.1 Fe-only nitrogenase accessory protein AnfO [Sodalis ligni]
MKIAVFVDTEGKTASLYQQGTIRVYESLPSGWQPVREIPFGLREDMGLAEIRAHILAMLADLDGCRHFVARAINGAMLSYFDGMGIVMWKLTGDPVGFLPRIQHIALDKTRQEQTAQGATAATFIKPGDAAGEYRLNLIDALKSDSALTSKQVLQPFLRRSDFTRLEIVCDHLPKWFDRELPALELTLAAEKKPDGRCYAVISRP